MRRISVFLSVLLVASTLATSQPILGEQPSVAAGASAFQTDADVVDPVVGTAAGPSAPFVEVEPPEPGEYEVVGVEENWDPVVAAAAIPQESGDVAVGATPVAVGLPAVGAARQAPPTARVSVLPGEFADQMSPFGAAVAMDFVDGIGADAAPSSAYEVSFDLDGLELGLAGAQSRLAILRHDGCRLYEPDPARFGIDPEIDTDVDLSLLPPQVECDSTISLESEIDRQANEIRSVVPEPQEIQAMIAADEPSIAEAARLLPDAVEAESGLVPLVDARAGLLDPDGGAGRAGLGGADDRVERAEFQADVDPGVTLFSLTSSVSSSAGDFSALPVPAVTDAEVGLFSGAAESSYPIPVPAAAAGPQPSVALVYSSATVDGLTLTENTQSGLLGVGWSLSAGGSITRGLKTCDNSGNKCLSSSPDDAYRFSLAGYSSKLVKVGSGTDPVSGAAFEEFRLEADPFWRVRLNTGGSVHGAAVVTPDLDNQWWSVETPEGMLYTLGTSDASIDWVPVERSARCGGVGGLCDTAWRWNVDVVRDAYGNEMRYSYGQELNSYRVLDDAQLSLDQELRDYVSASRIEAIEYGANPSQGAAANGRVQFEYEQRCSVSTVFGNCVWPDAYTDTPSDLWCSATVPFATGTGSDEQPNNCQLRSPSFFTALRLTGVLTQVADGVGSWVTVGNHDVAMNMERNDGASEQDSSYQSVLLTVAERPVSLNNEPYSRYGFNPLYVTQVDADQGVLVDEAGNRDVSTVAAARQIGDGDWIRFDDVWLGHSGGPSTEATLRFSQFRTGSLELRLDSPTGQLLASFEHSVDINRTNFRSETITFAGQTGVHDVYLVANTTETSNFAYVTWLQFGRNSYGPLPEVGLVNYWNGDFDWRANRLLHPGDLSAMQFPRVNNIVNQLGGRIEFDYGDEAAADCAGLTFPGTQGADIPSWDDNERRCYPDWFEGVYVVFNKWPVQSMTRWSPDGQGGDFSLQPAVTTTYDYTKPGWGFRNNPDSTADTWNEFRGYNVVRVSDGAGVTEYRFHQGLSGEPNNTAATPAAPRRSNNGVMPDDYALRGRVYEVARYNPNGTTRRDRQWTWYSNTATTSLTDRTDPRFVAPNRIDQWIHSGQGNSAKTSRTRFLYDAFGNVRSVREEGDVSNALDNRSTNTRFFPSTTTIGLGTWRGTMPCVTATRPGLSTGQPAQNNASGWERYTKTNYDGVTSTGCGTAWVQPTPTRSQVYATAPRGRLTTTYDVDNRGRTEGVTDPRGNSSSIAFDPLHGQITGTTNALGWSTAANYDAWRRPVSVADATTRETQTVYDLYGRTTAIVEPGDSLTSPTLRVTYNQSARPAYVQTERRLDGSAYTNSAEFVDGFGRSLLSRTLSTNLGQTWATANQYDNAGRVVRSAAQYGIDNDNVTEFAYPNWNEVPSFTETQYDSQSRPYNVRTRRGTGTSTANVYLEKFRYGGYTTDFYDRNNQLTETVEDGLGRTASVNEVAAGNLTTSYVYNSANDLLQVTAPDGFQTTLTYDLAGRKLTLDDPDSGEWEYGYDANSNLIEQIDPSNTVVTFDYDELNRATARFADGAPRASWNFATATLNRGLLDSSTSFNGLGNDVVQSMSYAQDPDLPARLLSMSTTVPDPTQPGTSSTFTTTYSNFRDDHRPATMSYPTDAVGGSGASVTTEFDARTGLEVGLDRDVDGRVIVDSSSWNHAGQLRTRLFGPAGADGELEIRYNSRDLRVTEIRGGTVANTGRWQRFQYAYDNNGNVTRIRDIRNSSQRMCFGYDALDRLVRAFTDNTNNCDGPTTTGAQNYDEIYTYSDGGNVLSRTGVGTYSYGDAAHVHAVTGTSDGSSFGYDTDGNMTTRNLAGEAAQTLTWDADQRLDQLVVAGGDTTDFLYDADGARVLRHTAGESTSFYPAGGTEYRIPDGAAGEFVYYYSVGGSTVAYEDAGTLTWLWTDHLGSSTLTRTESGSRNVQRYTPWGDLRSNANVTSDRHFTGQISDQQTGLAFYNARYYDPVVGRFISPDSIVPNELSGQDYNKYSYVANNPVRYTDPSGRCSEYLPCSNADATNSDEAETVIASTSFAERSGGAADNGVPWYNNVLGVAGTCVAGTTGCTAGGIISDQDIVNVSAGYLDAVSGGLAEDFLYSDIYVEQDSAAFGLGNLGGSVAMLPLEFNPIGQAYSRTSSGINAAIDCGQATQGGSGGDCGAAVTALGIDSITRGLGGLDSSLPVDGFVRTGRGLGADLAQNWGSNWNHFGGFGALNVGQAFAEIVSVFPTVASDFAISSLGGPQ